MDDTLPALALALDGLSLRGDYRFNLLPRALRPVRRRWQNVPAWALVGVNLLLLAALAARGPVEERVLLRRYREESAHIERPAALVERQLEKEKRIQQRLALIADFQRRGRRPLDALSDVAQKLPPDAWVSFYQCRQEQVDLAGTAKSASALLPALKTSAEFEDVQFAGALTREPTGEERFRIQARLRNAAGAAPAQEVRASR